MVDAGIIHQHIASAQDVTHELKAFDDLPFVGDVEALAESESQKSALQIIRDRIDHVVFHRISEEDGGPLLQESLSYSASEALCRTGDEYALMIEIAHRWTRLVRRIGPAAWRGPSFAIDAGAA